MTREEAIKTLREWRGRMASHGVPDFGEKYKALGMAIDALNHQTVFEQIKWERDMALQVLQGRYTPKGWFGEVEGKENEESEENE